VVRLYMGTSFRQNGAGNIAKITPHVGATTPTTREPDFYLHCNRWVFEAIQRLAERKVPVDLLTLSEELERAGQLEEVGGSAYLTGLINQVPSSLNAEAYAKIIANHATRRAMIQAANQIAALAYDEKNEVESAAEQAAKALEQAVMHTSGNALVPFDICLSEMYDRVQELSVRLELPGIATGIPEIDLLLGNLKPGSVYVIAARPGQGKTSVQLSVLLKAAWNNKRVAICGKTFVSSGTLIRECEEVQLGGFATDLEYLAELRNKPEVPLWRENWDGKGE